MLFIYWRLIAQSNKTMYSFKTHNMLNIRTLLSEQYQGSNVHHFGRIVFCLLRATSRQIVILLNLDEIHDEAICVCCSLFLRAWFLISIPLLAQFINIQRSPHSIYNLVRYITDVIVTSSL